MTIPTEMSLHGFISTAPELTFTGKGHARFFCLVGIEQHRKEVDGSFTKLDPVYCDLVHSTARPSGRTRGSSPATRSSPRATSTTTSRSAPVVPARSVSSSSLDASGTTAPAPATSWTVTRPSSPTRRRMR